MSISHKGSILPIRDMLIPIRDYDVLFPFDHHLTSTQLISPEGWEDHTKTDYGLYTGTNLCATLRKGEGKYGGAVAIEEGTTNLVENPCFSTGTKTGWIGGTLVEDGIFSLQGLLLESTTGRSDEITPSVELSPGQYTVSIWYKHIDGDIPYLNANGASGSVSDAYPFQQKNGWQRAVIQYDTDVKSKFYAIRYASASPEGHLSGKTIIGAMQIEQKPFATSFVEGSRNKGELILKPSNIGISPHGDWTISLWTKLTPGQTSWAAPIEFGNYYAVEESEFELWLNHSGSVKCYSHDNRSSSAINLFTPNEGELEEWCYFAISHDSSADKYYIYAITKDRRLQKEWGLTHSYPIADILKIGTKHTLNGLVDDLCISPKVLLEDQIIAIYESQRPLYDPQRIDYIVG